MAYKANKFFDGTSTAFADDDLVGGEIPVGVDSATTFRVDATVTSGDATKLELETHVGGDVWIVYGALVGAGTSGVLVPAATPVPLGSKVRLRVNSVGGATLTKAYITLSR